jgi:kynurenine formamidase
MTGLLDVLARGVRVYDLAQPLHPAIPSSPNHPGFKMALIRRHGDMIRADGGSAANELIVTGGHVGTHVDALAHVSHDGLLHGGVSAAEAQTGGRFSYGGIEQLAPLVAPGVLLDVAASKGVEILPGGYPISASDLEVAAQMVGVELAAGDVALVRTGWARNFADPAAFLGHDSGVPGPTEEAARWLVERGILATGSDTTAYEHIPPGSGHSLLPVHRLLLVEQGINVMEMLDLEGLAAAGVNHFCFVAAPLKIIGATGSPIRPLALVDA